MLVAEAAIQAHGGGQRHKALHALALLPVRAAEQLQIQPRGFLVQPDTRQKLGHRRVNFGAAPRGIGAIDDIERALVGHQHI